MRFAILGILIALLSAVAGAEQFKEVKLDPRLPAKDLLEICGSKLEAYRAQCEFDVNLLTLSMADAQGSGGHLLDGVCRDPFENTSVWQTKSLPALAQWLGLHPELGTATQAEAVAQAFRALFPCDPKARP